MNTIISLSPVARHRPRRSNPVRKGPGRPARPWLRPRIVIPHPVHPEALAAHIPQDQAAAWLGVSRATAARWAHSGPPPGPAGRLLALYAHGLALPPEAATTADGRAWARFRFWRQPGGAWVLVTPCSGEALRWTAVDDAGASRRRFARLAADLDRWRERAQVAEREAARCRDLLASGC